MIALICVRARLFWHVVVLGRPVIYRCSFGKSDAVVTLTSDTAHVLIHSCVFTGDGTGAGLSL